MNAVTMNSVLVDNGNEDNFGKSFAIALIIHCLLFFFKISIDKIEEKKEDEAIKVTIVSQPFIPRVEIKPIEEKKVVEEKKIEQVVQPKIAQAKAPMPNAKPAPRRLNPHHTSPAPAAKVLGKTKHPGPIVVKNGPNTAKFRAKNNANRVAHDSTGPGGPGKVGGPTGGHGGGEGYKGGLNIASELNGILAKSGGSSKASVGGYGNGGYGFKDGHENGSGIESITGSSDGKAMRLADISGNGVGKLADAASGKLDGRQGTAGLVSKKGVYMASLPAGSMEVMGGMDPNAIRRVLMENIAQFRYCYQKQLDRKGSGKEEGMVYMHFFIGSSGTVTKVNAEDQGLNNQDTLSCIETVLLGLQFPKPLRADGVVEVRQPMNFYANTR